MLYGYNRAREDALLESIGWPQDGYRLFEIATLDESSNSNGLGPVSESNSLFLKRELWRELGGMDERFDLPGGGLLNLDTFRRALELPQAELVYLLGEATFHQFHGGEATNSPLDRFNQSLQAWLDQYRAIRGRPFQLLPLKTRATYLGTLLGANRRGATVD
jgi:hypothetical protein